MNKRLKKVGKVLLILISIPVIFILVVGIHYELTTSAEEKSANSAQWEAEEQAKEIAKQEKQAQEDADAKKKAEELAKLQAEQEEKDLEAFKLIELAIKDLITAGVVTRIDTEFNEVYVNPIIWSQTPIAMKESTAKGLFAYCQKACEFRNYVTIKDNLTGKDLARYGLTGFKVY